jgi:D-tyrosyl-tRNA(Tyr) deacylase
MRALIQRVDRARVRVGERVTGEIGVGLLVLLGVEGEDALEDVEWLAGKVGRMRIFGDEEGQMNRSVVDVGGGILVVSQFTLHASTRKGNRPSFVRAARPEVAEPLYREFLARLGALVGAGVAAGEFGAMMSVELVNAGPVTIWVDSRARE